MNGELKGVAGFNESVYYVNKLHYAYNLEMLNSTARQFALCSISEQNYGFALCPHKGPNYGQAKPGDRLLIHPRSRVPISLLKKYKVVTDSDYSPIDKIVAPHEAGLYPWISKNHNSPVVDKNVSLFTNNNGIVLIVQNHQYDNLFEPDLDIVETVLNRDFCDRFPGHFVPLTHERYSLRYGDTISDLSMYIECAPSDKICRDSDLFIGEEKLTEEMLLSCYRMLHSSDPQIVDTAMLTMAQYDWHDYRELIKWMLSNNNLYNAAISLKGRNTAFQWLYNCTGASKWYFVSKFKQPTSIELAKKVIERDSDGAVSWTGTRLNVSPERAGELMHGNVRILSLFRSIR